MSFTLKSKTDTLQTESVELYDVYMGGVDKSAMNLALYHSKSRSQKWYHNIAFHIMSQCAVNAWVAYRQIGGQNSYLDFLSEIASVLVCNSNCINDTDESDT